MGCAASTEQTPEEAEKAKKKAGMRGSLVSDHSIKSHAERQTTPPGPPGTHKEEYYNAITGETTTITKSNTPSHHAPGSRLFRPSARAVFELGYINHAQGARFIALTVRCRERRS